MAQGTLGQFHYDAWPRVSGAELVAVCDRDRARAEGVTRKFGVPRSYTDVAEMLDVERPDFIDIITPPDTHLSLTRLAAERGVHVLCQKALAPSVREAALIVEEAGRAGIRFMVHDNFRFQPWHRELRRLLDRDAIGAPALHLVPHADGRRLAAGCLPGAAAVLPHDAPAADFRDGRALHRRVPVSRRGSDQRLRAAAATERRHQAGEDTGIVLFEFASGAVGLWDANRYNESLATDPRYTFGDFLLEGDRGALRLDEEGRMSVHRLGEGPREHAYAHDRRGFAGDCVHATLQHFVDALRAGTPFETDGRELPEDARRAGGQCTNRCVRRARNRQDGLDWRASGRGAY